MNNLKVIIVDDEPDAHKLINYYCLKIGGIEIVNQFYDALTALEYLQNNEVQLLFLDIEMPQISGIQLLSMLPKHPPVILTTAYSSYAVESYEHNVIDYLLKPIQFNRFEKALEKLNNKIQVDKTLPLEIEIDNKIINPTEVLYAEAFGNYAKLFISDSKYILLHETFKNIENKLSSYSFIRCHKGFIVATNKITAIDHNNLTLINFINIPIGISFKQQIKNAVNL